MAASGGGDATLADVVEAQLRSGVVNHHFRPPSPDLPSGAGQGSPRETSSTSEGGGTGGAAAPPAQASYIEVMGSAFHELGNGTALLTGKFMGMYVIEEHDPSGPGYRPAWQRCLFDCAQHSTCDYVALALGGTDAPCVGHERICYLFQRRPEPSAPERPLYGRPYECANTSVRHAIRTPTPPLPPVPPVPPVLLSPPQLPSRPPRPPARPLAPPPSWPWPPPLSSPLLPPPALLAPPGDVSSLAPTAAAIPTPTAAGTAAAIGGGMPGARVALGVLPVAMFVMCTVIVWLVWRERRATRLLATVCAEKQRLEYKQAVALSGSGVSATEDRSVRLPMLAGVIGGEAAKRRGEAAAVGGVGYRRVCSLRELQTVVETAAVDRAVTVDLSDIGTADLARLGRPWRSWRSSHSCDAGGGDGSDGGGGDGGGGDGGGSCAHRQKVGGGDGRCANNQGVHTNDAAEGAWQYAGPVDVTARCQSARLDATTQSPPQPPRTNRSPCLAP